MMNEFKDIDSYIASFPAEIQSALKKIRTTIKEVAPEATEAMAYGMPTFRLNGNLVHFAGYKDHIGFYPAPTGIDSFREELAPYRTGKGTIRFSLDEPIPFELIKKVVQYRVKENLNK